MVNTAIATAKFSNGQYVLTFKKDKKLLISPGDFAKLLRLLLDEKQQWRCALTGIPLQFDGDFTDEQLVVSLDRIDSDGDYEANNLQLVCKFVNSWKSNMEDQEFRRLLALVRDETYFVSLG